MRKEGFITLSGKMKKNTIFQDVVRTSWENGIIDDFEKGEHF